MKHMKRTIIGLLLTTIASLTFGAGGHGVQVAAIDTDNHHTQDHQSGASHDDLADVHTDKTECHATDSLALITPLRSNDQVIIISTVQMYAVENSHTTQDQFVSSLREKIPLFEMANVHTTTLALRV